MDYTEEQIEEYFTSLNISAEDRNPEDLKILIHFLDMCHLHHDLAIVLKYRIYHCTGDLSDDERKIFISNCKELLTSIRSTWQDVQSHRFKSRTDPFSYKVVMMCIPWFTNQIVKYCKTIVECTDMAISKVEPEDEAVLISYLKTKADYFRYLVEVDFKEEIVQESLDCYQKSWNLAQKLPACDFSRLSIALNFSVFYYEIKKDKKAACDLALEAQMAARNCKELAEEMDDKMVNKTDMILKLIEDNYSSWMARDITTDEDSEICINQPIEIEGQS